MPEIQASEYSSFGTIVAPPDRPEPARVDLKLDEIEYHAVLRMFNWSEADFESASRFGRPGSLGRRIDPRNHHNLLSVFSKRQLNTWRADLCALADALR